MLGQGAGLNPVNYVCIARPRFEALAIRHASEIGQETGGRSLLLLTIPALGEMVLRCAEGRWTASNVCDFMATHSGSIDLGDLDSIQPKDGNEQSQADGQVH